MSDIKNCEQRIKYLEKELDAARKKNSEFRHNHRKRMRGVELYSKLNSAVIAFIGVYAVVYAITQVF